MPEIIKDLIRRDISQKVEGVVKVFDRSALASEIREYVVTDKIEDEIKKIVDTFTQASDVLRRGGHHRDVMGIWISGFFGSGKSHFAKVLGYLLQNEALVTDNDETCIDAFEKHLSESPRGRDIRLRLGEIKKTTSIRTIAFEIRSRQSLTNPNSVGEILLGEFYRNIGYSENFVIARIERRLDKKGLLPKLHQAFQQRFGIAWDDPEGRDDLATVRRKLSKVLPEVDPQSYPTEDDALTGLDDAFEYSKITAESIADELVAWVDEQKPAGGKVQHLVFVIDEMGTFIGDSNEKIGELNSLAEMIGNKGKGKVWIIATSQQDLEKVVDRTNFDPVLVGRLNARFELKPHLISDGINKVVSERILKKHPHKEDAIAVIFKEREGALAQLSDLRASRSLGLLTERAFIDAYPFLPHQIQLAQDIGEALSGFRISGGVRSMISVIMESLQKLASKEIPTIASFDHVFDALENDLYSQEYLGTAGVKAIYDANDRIGKETPLPPARVLKVLYLVQRVTFVPLTAENIAKLLASSVTTDVKFLTEKVEQTLDALQQAGYVSRDEATGEWKFLNEKERTVEQVIQEMMRPGGAKSVTQTAIRQQSIDLIKTGVITKTKLDNYAVLHGATKSPFAFAVSLDGESVDSGSEIEIHFTSPLAPGRKTSIDELRAANQAAGARGRKIWWVAALPEKLETRLKRYQALINVTNDKRFTEDPSKDTADAMAEKRKERDELKGNLTKDLQATFLTGTLYFAGREVTLERSHSMAEEIRKAVGELIPNIYPRFSVADKPVDFAKQLKALLNPSQSSLHEIAPDLHLFDTQGSLQKESALVSTVLDVIKDLEAEGHEPSGARLLDERNAKGFKGFSRAPFAWPSETVRLVLAASFRAGAIFLERATAAGPAPLYDYKDASEDFSKIKTFEKTLFRLAETSLSVEQIKQASKDLISLGITGTPESGNALATAIRKLGEKLLESVRDAEVRSEGGLPILDCILHAESALKESTTLRDPTKAVIAFLAKAPAWLEIKKALDDLKSFLDANRHKEFESSRQLVALVTDHPLPADSDDKEALEHSLADIDALVSANTVVPRWSDYRTARDQIFQIYSAAYRQSYDKLRGALASTLESIRQGKAYESAPADKREGVLHAVFGSGGSCHLPEVSITTLPALLSCAAKTSLSALAQAEKALPVHRGEVEAALRALKAPPPPPKEGAKTFTWHSSSALSGRRFASEEDVDAALQEVGDDLKQRIRDGFVIDTI